MVIRDSQQAQFLEIFEKGVAKSTERLSALSGQPWNIHIISVDIGSGDRFLAIIARDKREHMGFSFESSGEKYLVLFSEESGEALAKASAPACLGRRDVPPGMEQAALSEVANILINGLSCELADRQGMVRIISAPTAIKSSKADIYNKAFGNLPSTDPTMVNALIHISSPELAADCTLMLRFDSVSATFLLTPDPDGPASEACV